MKGEQEAMEIFQLVKGNQMLPSKIEDLVPLSFMGEAALSFYRTKIKLMNQLKMAEDQREATLSDGQDAGEMLLNIESRIGEIASKEIPAKPKSGGKGGGSKPSGVPLKHERLGMDRHRMDQSQQIFNNPDAVKRVLKEARENMDIPTKTAVLSEIRHKKEMEGKIEKERSIQEPKSKGLPSIDNYVSSAMNDIDNLESQLVRIRSNLSYVESDFVRKTFKGKLENLLSLIQKTIGELNEN